MQALGVAVAAFGVYANTLSNGFVYDDADQVLKNRWITDIRYVPDMFMKSVWSFQSDAVVSNYYRPLMHLGYLVNYHLFGLKPWGFHLVNVLFHCSVAVLVLLVVAALIEDTNAGVPVLPTIRAAVGTPAFIAAMLFATHPIHTEPVAWVAGLPELSFTLFCLASFYLHLRAHNGFGRNYWLSVAAFSVASFCKETALTLPILLVACDGALRRWAGGVPALLKRYGPYGVVAAIYLVLRQHALGGFAPEQRHVYLTPYEYVLNVFPLFREYLQKLIAPLHLNAFHVLHPIRSILDGDGMLSLVVAVGFGVLAGVFWKRNRIAFLGMALIAVPLIPVLYIPALGENSFAERYLYLPSVGFCMLLSLAVQWTRRLTIRRYVGVVLVVPIVLVYATATIRRNAIWKDDESLYVDTLAKSPDAVLMQYNFGNILMDSGRVDEAAERFQTAIALNPGFVRAHTNLGVLFIKKGWVQRGVEQLETAVRVDPYMLEARRDLGTAYGQMGALDKATEQFRAVAQLEPDSAQAQSDLGMALANQGFVQEAVDRYRLALTLDANYADAHYNLGRAYDRQGRQEDAIAEYRKAVALDPNFVDARGSLADALVKAGESEAAMEQFEVLVRLRPEDAPYHNLLGIEYAKRGALDAARTQFEAAVRLDPNEPAYRRNLERATTLRNPPEE